MIFVKCNLSFAKSILCGTNASIVRCVAARGYGNLRLAFLANPIIDAAKKKKAILQISGNLATIDHGFLFCRVMM